MYCRRTQGDRGDTGRDVRRRDRHGRRGDRRALVDSPVHQVPQLTDLSKALLELEDAIFGEHRAYDKTHGNAGLEGVVQVSAGEGGASGEEDERARLYRAIGRLRSPG